LNIAIVSSHEELLSRENRVTVMSLKSMWKRTVGFNSGLYRCTHSCCHLLSSNWS